MLVLVLVLVLVLLCFYRGRAPSAVALWDLHVRSLPAVQRTSWAPHGSSDFSVVLVEFRDHPWMEGVLNNMASVYGDRGVSLVVVHGIDNAAAVEGITRNWEHAALIRLPVRNLDIEGYNDLLTDARFWDLFASRMVLIFQTDTLIRRPIDPEFFEYDYVGAPWRHPVEHTKGVENGGWSLRNVESMKRVCREHERGDLYEDVFFSRHCESIPPPEVARRFSVESVYHPDPCGLHKPYAYQAADRVRSLLPDLSGPRGGT
jgi:hypothetical protein